MTSSTPLGTPQDCETGHCTCHGGHGSQASSSSSPHWAAEQVAGWWASDRCKFCRDFYEKAQPYVCVACWKLVQEYITTARAQALEEAVKVAKTFEPDQRASGVTYASDAIAALQRLAGEGT